MAQSPEELVAAHVAGSRLQQIPVDAIAAAKRSIIDAFAVMAAGSAAPGVKTLVDIAQRGAIGNSRILLSGARTKAAQAAWANAIQMRALELDDCTDFAPSHPSAAIIPALLAVADAHTITGADFLRGAAIGQDLAVRFYRTVKNSVASGRNDMHRIFAATAAIAAALNFDADTTRNAMGLAAAGASGDMQSSFEGTMSSWVQTANSARAAIESCTLSLAGVSGAKQFLTGRAGYLNAFEPEHTLEALVGGLGQAFQGASIAIKPYAACRAQHAIVDMARELHQLSGPIDADDVASIEITVSPPVFNLVGTPVPEKIQPSTAHAAQFSAYFAMAVGLRRGGMGLADSAPAALADPAIHALTAKMKVIASEANATDEIIGRTDVKVVLSNGETFARSSKSPLGGPRNPMTAAALRAKLDDCIAYAGVEIAADTRAQFIASVERLEEAPAVDVLANAFA